MPECQDRDDTETLESRDWHEPETLECRDRDEIETLEWWYGDETEPSMPPVRDNTETRHSKNVSTRSVEYIRAVTIHVKVTVYCV